MLCLSLSQNYHTSSNCPLRTAAAILSRRSATPPLSGPAEACGEGATGGDGSGIISFDGWLSESLVLFFFFPFSALREAESRDREREREAKIKPQRGSDSSFSLVSAGGLSLSHDCLSPRLKEEKARRGERERVVSKKRGEKGGQSRREKTKSSHFFRRERGAALNSFSPSLSSALLLQQHVGSYPAAVTRRRGRVQRR